MKKLFLSLIAIALLSFYACKESTNSESTMAEESVEIEEAVEAPDYDLFNSRTETMRAFFKAHENEDIEAIRNLLADTLKVSPPNYNGNQMVGKDEFIASLQNYHDNFENINFTEGITLGDIQEGGWWSGSVYPKESASVSADAIRIYGTWKATHSESGKEIGIKFYSIAWMNNDGKLAQYSSYFDVNGIAAQLAEE
jgi:hypothetical protein